MEEGRNYGHEEEEDEAAAAEASSWERAAKSLHTRNTGHASDEGEREEYGEVDGDEGPSAPLLSAPRNTPDARGTMALRMLPGAPRLPARTGRRQLDDVMALSSSHALHEQDTGKVRLADVQVKSSGQRRWCGKCDAPKPDRAHHCSVCKVCVLRVSVV